MKLNLFSNIFVISFFVFCSWFLYTEINKPHITKITPHNYNFIKENINKPTIIHFWFSYCSPCIKDFPELLKISKKHNIELINISSDISDSEMQDNLEKVMKKLNVKNCYIIDFNNLYPNGTTYINVLSDFAKKINLKNFTNPYYILIDKKGKTIIETEKIEKIKQKLILI